MKLNYGLVCTTVVLGYGGMDKIGDVLRDTGYEDMDDQEALNDGLVGFTPPYPTDLHGHIKWVEFCRALREDDFSIGDTFTLNGIAFEVKG